MKKKIGPIQSDSGNLIEKVKRLVRVIYEPNELDLLDDFSTISLWFVCAYHEDTEDNHIKTILEELFFLCTNDDFKKTIQETREILEKKSGVTIPSKDRECVRRFRTLLYAEGQWSWYQEILSEVRRKHSLHGEAYGYGDPLETYNMRNSIEEMRDLITGDPAYSGLNEQELEEKAKEWALEEALDPFTTLTALERIIFYNDPFYKNMERGIPHSNRGGHLRFGTDFMTGDQYIEGKFYLNSTKTDMKNVIDDQYEKIAERREKLYGIRNRRDAHKEDLFRWYRVFQLHQGGKNEIQIAAEIEEEFGGEMSLENVRMTLKRLGEESSRFNMIRTR